MLHTFCDSCGAVRTFRCMSELERLSKTGLCRECWKIQAPKGPESSRWNGGVTYSDGYRLIRVPDHPNTDRHGYVREHRLVVEKRLGRYLEPDEVVHHINRNRLDNRDDNLVLTNQVEHTRDLHPKVRGQCYICGEPQEARGLCRKHYWSYFLKDHRRINGYHKRKRIRIRTRKPTIPNNSNIFSSG